jgi:predicted enzyme related to lactoylglutathione lyase
MARVQLALNGSDIDAAVDFYRKWFGSALAQCRPGYATYS